MPHQQLAHYLDCLQVVMVNTTLPANIGSAARAMHTMGLSRLTVVNPKLPIDETSQSHAAGGIDVLNQAHISPTLEQALQSCQLVFAASSRSRHLPRPMVTPNQAAAIIRQFIDQQSQNCQDNYQDNVTQNQSNQNKPSIAIVFGREDRGLTNDELAHADYHIQIQANHNYPVLNVASAIQVIASFIFAHIEDHVLKYSHNAQNTQNHDGYNGSNDGSDDNTSPIINVPIRQHWDEPAISHEQSQQLNQRLITLMTQLQLADPNDLRSLPNRLSRLTSRLQLDQKEYQLINAIIAKLNS